jgi:hypothetical protein
MTKPNGMCTVAGLLTLAGLALVGCSGVEPASFVADEEYTMEQAEKNRVKLCYVHEDEVCQSPDSALVFHLPRELNLTSGKLQLSDEITVSNEGFNDVVIEEYRMGVMDNNGVTYPVQFTSTNGYNETQPFRPALELGPHQEASVVFTARLNPNASEIRAFGIMYRLKDEQEERRVVVSYRPRGLRALDEDDTIYRDPTFK